MRHFGVDESDDLSSSWSASPSNHGYDRHIYRSTESIFPYRDDELTEEETEKVLATVSIRRQLKNSCDQTEQGRRNCSRASWDIVLFRHYPSRLSLRRSWECCRNLQHDHQAQFTFSSKSVILVRTSKALAELM